MASRRREGYPVYDDMRLSDTGGQIGTQRQRLTSLGSTAEIAESDLGPTPQLYGNFQPIGPRRRLLSIDPKDAPDDSPGSWVVSLAGRVLETGPGNPGITRAVPAIAYIGFGKGGVLQEVEVDAWRNLIALPGDTAYIDVQYNQFGVATASPDPAYAPTALFRRVGFKATAHRTLETGEAIPTRSYYNVAPLGGVSLIPVPPFATSWTIIPNNFQVVSGSLPYEVLIRSAITTGGGMILDTPVPEVVESMARTLCFRPLPSGAGLLQLLTNGPGAATKACQVVFRLGL